MGCSSVVPLRMTRLRNYLDQTVCIPIRDNRITIFYHIPDEESVISRSRKKRKKV